MSGLGRIDEDMSMFRDILERGTGRLTEQVFELFRFKPDGYVYVLGTPVLGYYKIGRAKKVDSRVKQLKIQLPFPVEILHVIPAEDYVRSERKLHSIFNQERANGEWFALEGWQVEWLQTIERMRGVSIEDRDEK